MLGWQSKTWRQILTEQKKRAGSNNLDLTPTYLKELNLDTKKDTL